MSAVATIRSYTICRFAGLNSGVECYGPWCRIVCYDRMKATARAWRNVHPAHRVWVERR